MSYLAASTCSMTYLRKVSAFLRNASVLFLHLLLGHSTASIILQPHTKWHKHTWACFSQQRVSLSQCHDIVLSSCSLYLMNKQMSASKSTFTDGDISKVSPHRSASDPTLETFQRFIIQIGNWSYNLLCRIHRSWEEGMNNRSQIKTMRHDFTSRIRFVKITLELSYIALPLALFGQMRSLSLVHHSNKIMDTKSLG